MDEYSLRLDRDDCGPSSPAAARNAFNGRIMLISAVILLAALLVIAFFHTYTRGLLLRRSRQRLHNQRIRRPLPNSIPPQSQGLAPTVLKSLPTFVYSSKLTHSNNNTLLECAVCLSEFDDDETGRILPNCNHCFHVACIDMWFHSHSSCPLCRAPVQNQNPEGTVFLVVQLEQQPEMDAASGGLLCPNAQRIQDQMGCSNSPPPIVRS